MRSSSGVALFLAPPAAAYITGQTIVVDGGNTSKNPRRHVLRLATEDHLMRINLSAAAVADDNRVKLGTTESVRQQQRTRALRRQPTITPLC
jgi:hypothetical protein